MLTGVAVNKSKEIFFLIFQYELASKCKSDPDPKRHQNQGCGSGLDPDSIGSVDPVPDPDSESGSGSRRAKMTHKSRKNLLKFMFMLDGLF
jgi:hypothetical protein